MRKTLAALGARGRGGASSTSPPGPLETEAKLAHSGVGGLLDGVHDAFDELPPPQAHALRAALLLEAPVRAGSISAASRSVFSVSYVRSPSNGPVLVAVDDLQWLDAASSRLLLRRSRRAGAELVALRGCAARRDRGRARSEPAIQGSSQQPAAGAAFARARPGVRRGAHARGRVRLHRAPVAPSTPSRASKLLARIADVRGSQRHEPGPEGTYQALSKFGRDLTERASRESSTP